MAIGTDGTLDGVHDDEVERHVDEIGRAGYTVLERVVEPRPRRRAGRRPGTAGAGARGRAGPEQLRGRPYDPHLQPAGPREAVRGDSSTSARPAGGRARPRSRLPRVVAVVDQHPPGRTGPADPRRRPADP